MSNQAELSRKVQEYYDAKRNDRNFLMSGDTDYVNHHFGIGCPNLTGDSDITTILNRMELNQMDVLASFMGIETKDHIFDAGCGRGGTMFYLRDKFGCSLEGITISPYQHEFCEMLACSRDGASHENTTKFHLGNYLNTGIESSSFDQVYTNETTQYVENLPDLFRELNRLLKPGGRYTIATWCKSDSYPDSEYAKRINEHYGTTMHTISQYKNSLKSTGFKDVIAVDYTEAALPYWKIRANWEHKSGVENDFIEGHINGEIKYYFLTATKSV